MPSNRALDELVGQLNASRGKLPAAPRWLAVRLLEGDDLASQVASAQVRALACQHARAIGDELDILVADARYGLAHRVAGAAVKITGRTTRDMTDRIDRVVLNRALGIPIFFVDDVFDVLVHHQSGWRLHRLL